MIRPLLFLQALLASVAASAATFEYVNPIDSASLTIDTTVPSVAIGDIARKALICDKQSGFVCVESDVFSFAIPTEVEARTMQWKHGGRTYSIESRANIVLLGTPEYGALQISSMDGDRRLFYLYSPANGLLAVEVRTKDGSKLFLASGKTGYGARSRQR